ncbi:MAG: cob(I)yrinic acid a,c-diamide adenosyltransferase [Spirochaetota bacterium]
MDKKKGLLIVFTGDGKGKTTAALGTAMRCGGHKLFSCMIQFVKGSWASGEIVAVDCLKEFMEIHAMGRGFIKNGEGLEEHRDAALKAWNFAKDVMKSGKFSLVILDELTYPLNFKLLDEEEVVSFLVNRREGLHVIVTGRNAPKSLIDAADLVTEMKDLKHPYNRGIIAQKGIDF